MELKDYFINKKNRKNCSNIFNKIILEGLAFKTNINRPVVKYKKLDQIKKEVLENLPEESMDIEKVIEECKERIINGAVNFSSENFLAFPDSGNSIAAVGGHLLYGFLNQNLINSMHCSPTATFVEITVINWLRQLLGYKIKKIQNDSLDAGGINVPGGTLANTIAILLAREKIYPGTMKNGLNKSNKPLFMFIPEGIGHYTSRAAMGWLGIGMDNIVNVKTSDSFTIDREDLIRKIKQTKERGTPFIIIAYAGDSRTMAIDNFKELSKIAKKYGLWLHVDACHGASLAFTKTLRHKLNNIYLADSITIDPHKVLWVPYNSSYLLLKDPESLMPIAGVSALITKAQYSFGQVTPFLGSRAFTSLKVWFLIKNLGRKKIGQLIKERHKKAVYFSNLIKKSKDFYLMNNVEINSVVYLYIPTELKKELGGSNKNESINKINELNLRIQKRMFRKGSFYVHTFKLNDFKNILKAGRGKVYQMQRLMIGNPLTTKKDLKSLITETNKIARAEWKSLIESAKDEK
mgnify:CR=1 FL=1